MMAKNCRHWCRNIYLNHSDMQPPSVANIYWAPWLDTGLRRWRCAYLDGSMSYLLADCMSYLLADCITCNVPCLCGHSTSHFYSRNVLHIPTDTVCCLYSPSHNAIKRQRQDRESVSYRAQHMCIPDGTTKWFGQLLPHILGASKKGKKTRRNTQHVFLDRSFKSI